MALRGKVALVTGGKRQIGRGIALALADAGAAVVAINDLEVDADATETLRLLEQAGCKTAFFAADVSSSQEVNAMFASFLAKFGRIDVLANNPYKWEAAPFAEISEESWDVSTAVVWQCVAVWQCGSVAVCRSVVVCVWCRRVTKSVRALLTYTCCADVYGRVPERLLSV